MNEIIQAMLPYIGSALGILLTGLTAYLCSYLNKQGKLVEAKISSEKGKTYMERILQTITDCVIATNQTYVDALKKENAFTKEAQQQAFSKSLNNVLDILEDDALEYLGTITNDVQAWLMSKIESTVNEVKK